MINFFLKIFYLLRRLPILKRFLNSFLRRILFTINKDKFIYTYKKSKFILNIRDSIDREFFMNGYYENEQIKILSNKIREYSINFFIDIGSNIGIYSILMANQFSNLEIHAFEPHKDAFSRLRNNINLNKLSNKVNIYQYALSNKAGTSFLETKNRFKISQSGGAKISSKGDTKIRNEVGDSLLKIKNENIAIKIDTEGHELFVLHGIINLLSNNKIFLQIEIFPENVHNVTNFLNSLGFKLVTKNQFTHQKNILDYFFEKNLF